MNKYLGRKAVVRNLLGPLSSGTSAVVMGGPKMGKTTFLQQISESLSPRTRPILMDLKMDRPSDLSQKIPDTKGSVILLLDGCETLLPDPSSFLKQVTQNPSNLGAKICGTVWAGNVAWGEWATAHKAEFISPIRFYPLILLPPKEARPFLENNLPEKIASSKLQQLLDLAGGPPFLLSGMIKKTKEDYDTFFMEIWKAVEKPSERRILIQLIEAGSWVFLQDLKNETGDQVDKGVLDRLAILGLIDRTLIDGAAAVKAVSPLLGDWVMRTGAFSSRNQDDKRED